MIVGNGLPSIVGRMGGKTRLKANIVNNYFPKDYEKMTYVEPFIGGGAVYFYKEPSVKEVINDIDPQLIQVYKGFKKYDGDKITKSVDGHYTKEEFIKLRDSKPTTEYAKFIRLLLLFKMSFFGKLRSYDNKGQIIRIYDDRYKERLKNTTILNTTYKNVISKYDSPNTFFYLDPPYEGSDKGIYDFPDMDYEELAHILSSIKGKFLMSINVSPRIKQLFNKFKFQKVKTEYTSVSASKSEKSLEKTEYIISNY